MEFQCETGWTNDGLLATKHHPGEDVRRLHLHLLLGRIGLPRVGRR